VLKNISIVWRLKALLRPLGKLAFILNLDPNSKILDVGCGNNSPAFVKKFLPGCTYYGLDIGNYNQSAQNIANHYLLVSPNEFSSTIAKYENYFDAIISSHNIEHCNDPSGTLKAMAKALAKEGKIYLSTPCEASINFPSREGTLNFYDDSTHIDKPMHYQELITLLKDGGISITKSTERNRPPFFFLLGALLEPCSYFSRRVLKGTWDYYGFESIIWGTKHGE
jgi:2-polyprenyl-3-methyl-5-hydroxy-6-metoxy-1,4-benzoquinol methylase